MLKSLAASILFTLTASLNAQVPNTIKVRQLSDDRVAMQSRFFNAQNALGRDPLKAPAEAQIAMESVSKALAQLKEETLRVLNERYTFWNNQGYWGNYWEKGPAAKFVLIKLRAELDKAAAIAPPISGPFGKPELNTFQKQLDYLRSSLDLDRDLQQKESQLKKK